MEPEEIARVCHEANRALQAVQSAHGIPVGAPWDGLDEETRTSVIQGVHGIQAGKSPEESHEAWCEFKRDHGWTHGEVKDAAALTHPCLLPYADLPADQRVKDDLFSAIVKALS